MNTVTLSSKGQLVIPRQVRTTAQLNPGDRFEVHYFDGEIRLKPIAPFETKTLDEVAGCLANLGRSSAKQMSNTQVRAAIKARLLLEDEVTMSKRSKRQTSAA